MGCDAVSRCRVSELIAQCSRKHTSEGLTIKRYKEVVEVREQALVTTALFSIPIVLPFSECHINGIIE